MRTEPSERFPSYGLWIVWGLCLMLVTAWAIAFLDLTPLQPIYSVVHQRGPTPYLVLWVGFAVAGATAWALWRHESRRKAAKVLYTLAALPLLPGALGTVQGMRSVHRACEAWMKHSGASADPAGLEVFRSVGTRFAWDPSILAIIVSSICLLLAAHLWVRLTKPPSPAK